MPVIMVELPASFLIEDKNGYVTSYWEIYFRTEKDPELSQEQIYNCDLVVTVNMTELDEQYFLSLIDRAKNNPESLFLMLLANDRTTGEKWLADNFLQMSITSNNGLKIDDILATGKTFLNIARQYKSRRDIFEKQLAELNKIGIALSSEKNLDVLLNMILKEARNLTHADAGSLYIKEGDNLIFKVAQNETIDKKMQGKQEFVQFRIPISTKSIAGYVAERKKLLNIQDVHCISKDSPYQHNTSFDEKFGYRTCSILTFPMMDNQGELIGVMQLINAMDDNGEAVPFARSLETIVESLGSQAAVSIKNAMLLEDINNLLMSVLEYSSALIDARSRHTAGHSHRVAHMTIEIARAISKSRKPPFDKVILNDDEMQELYFAALLHDIGKIGVPEYVLDKTSKLPPASIDGIKWRFMFIRELLQGMPTDRDLYFNDNLIKHGDKGNICEILDQLIDTIEFVNQSNFLPDDEEEIIQKFGKSKIKIEENSTKLLNDDELEQLMIKRGNLTQKERDIINNHIQLTIDTLEKIPFPKHLAGVPFYAGQHHEKLDGSGYPRGLAADEIPLQSRILAISDFIDALSAQDRPYRKGIPIEKTLGILEEEAEKNHYDRDIVKFIKEGIKDDSIKIPWYIME